jgi:hypothetical protein
VSAGGAKLARALAVLASAGSWLATAAIAMAASPSPGSGGDPRSSGQGPGLVGDPLLAVGAVLAIGLGAVLLTLAYVRLTSRGGN